MWVTTGLLELVEDEAPLVLETAGVEAGAAVGELVVATGAAVSTGAAACTAAGAGALEAGAGEPPGAAEAAAACAVPCGGRLGGSRR